MAESLEFIIDVDAQEGIEETTKMTKLINQLDKELNAADRAVKSFTKAQSSMGNTIDKNNKVIDKNGKEVKEATTQYAALTNQSNQLKKAIAGVDSNMANFTNAANDSGKSTARFNNAVQNASYQITDFTTQINGGQNAMLAFSQQFPQMIGGLGALGGAIGVVTTLLAAVYLNTNKTTTALQQMEKATENVKAVLTLSADGFINYSDNMKVLTKLSKDLVKVQLAATINEQNKAIKQGAIVLSKALDDATGSFDTYTDRVTKLTKTKVGTDEFVKAEKAVREFSSAIDMLKLAQTEDNISRVEQALIGFQEAGALSTQKGSELVTESLKMIAAFKQGKITIDQLNKALNDTAVVSDRDATSIKSLTDALSLQAATIGMTDRQVALYVANLKKANETEIKAINAAYDKIEAHEKEIESYGELSDAIDEVIKDTEEETKANHKQAETIAGYVQAAQDKVNALSMTNEQIAVNKALQAGANEQDIQAIRNSYAQIEALKLQKQETENLNATMKSLGSSAQSAFTSILTGASTGTEAVKQFTNQLINQLVNYAIQSSITSSAVASDSEATTSTQIAGTQAVASSNVLASTTSTAAALASISAITAASVAAGNASLAAWAPAATAASIASFGGAAIAGEIALLAAVASSTAAFAGMGAALSSGSGRAQGGPIEPGRLYPINEIGQEAITFNNGNQQMLLSNSKATITSASDLAKQGSSVGGIINVNINGSNVSSSGASLDLSKLSNSDLMALGKKLDSVTRKFTSRKR